MSKYADKTEPDINKLVAERLGMKTASLPIGRDKFEIIVINDEANKFRQFDPCNNPTDAWPIILEYKIGINTIGIKGDEDRVWWAELTFDVYGDNHYAEDKNPLRAAMIVYLMMEGEL